MTKNEARSLFGNCLQSSWSALSNDLKWGELRGEEEEEEEGRKEAAWPKPEEEGEGTPPKFLLLVPSSYCLGDLFYREIRENLAIL
ncbi:hypothetical protein LINPERHAP1_LOCUS14571 [Linum perenne]